MTLYDCGSIHRLPIPIIADRAARALAGHHSPRAVTLALDGRVAVEPPHSASECDLVGVYTASIGLLGLSRLLIEDLRHEVETRQLKPLGYRTRPQRTVLKRGEA
jgi:hypothetical protein